MSGICLQTIMDACFLPRNKKMEYLNGVIELFRGSQKPSEAVSLLRGDSEH